MRAVILAAGDGGRLGKRTAGIPKPLISAGGRPLIAYTLEALAENGIDDITVVTGYLGGQLRAGLAEGWHGNLRFVANPRFTEGAALSLRAAREVAGASPFLLLMADHLLSAEIVAKLLEQWRDGGPSLLATDGAAWPETYAHEATRVRLEPGTARVVALGKHLEPWDALDTGAFLLSPEVWNAVDATPEDSELSVVFGDLARRGRLEAADVTGARWYDVDTEEDLEAASRMLAGGRP